MWNYISNWFDCIVQQTWGIIPSISGMRVGTVCALGLRYNGEKTASVGRKTTRKKKKKGNGARRSRMHFVVRDCMLNLMI